MLAGTWRRGWRCLGPLPPTCYAPCKQHVRLIGAITLPRSKGFDARNVQRRKAEATPPSTKKGQRGTQPASSSSHPKPKRNPTAFFSNNVFEDEKKENSIEDEDLYIDKEINEEHGEEGSWKWATEEARNKLMEEDEKRRKEEEEMVRAQVNEQLEKLDPLERHLMKKFAFRLELAQKYPKKYDKHVWNYFQLILKKEELVGMMGDDAWVYLWNLETHDVPLKRRIELFDVMLKCEADIQEKHMRGYIEALFWHGQRDRAMHIWETMLHKSESLRFWNLGVKMFATELNANVAEQVADDCIKNLGVGNAMTYTPVIVSYLNLIEATGIRHDSRQAKEYNKDAMRAYQSLKKVAKANMTEEEYLRIASSFVDAKFLKSGLTVYEDMVYQIPSAFDHISREQLRNVLDTLQKAQNEAAGIAQISPSHEKVFERITERTMKLIPEDKKDTILYLNWIRCLAKLKKVDAAMRLLLQVHEQTGILPDTETYNTLLEAMLTTRRVDQFEELGKSMIKQAIDRSAPLRATGDPIKDAEVETQMQSSFNELGLSKPLSMPRRMDNNLHSAERPDEELFPMVLAMTPHADARTFSLFARFCNLRPKKKKNNKQDDAEHSNTKNLSRVLTLMVQCQVKPKIYLFNNLINTLLRKKDIASLWLAFQRARPSFVDDYKPNRATYKILWHGIRCKKFSFTPCDNYPPPRVLFRMMMEDGVVPDRDLYNVIIKAFYKQGDLIGGYIVLNACERLWKLAPGVISIGNMLRGICRMKSFDYHIGAAMHRQTYRAIRERAADVFGKWAGNPLTKPDSFRQKRNIWRAKRRKDWEVIKDLPMHERPFYKYAPTEKDLPKEGQDIDDPNPNLVRQLGKLYYGIDDVVPNANTYLRKISSFLFSELAMFKQARNWSEEILLAVEEMGLQHVQMEVIDSQIDEMMIQDRYTPTTM